MEPENGWNESGLLDDSTRLIVSDGIHLVHMGNGEGPSYAMPTGASDYKEAVALGALGVVTGVLTGFAAVPTGPKKVMELVLEGCLSRMLVNRSQADVDTAHRLAEDILRFARCRQGGALT